MNGKRLALFAFAAALLLLSPPVSRAATVRVGTLSGGDYATAWVGFRAAPGERNRVRVVVAGRRRVVISDRVPVRPGVGCRRPDPANLRVVRCEMARGPDPSGVDYEPEGVRVFLGDQADSAKVSRGRRSFGSDSLSGGPGNDLLVSGPGGVAFTGGPGDDQMLGGTGYDSFTADASLDGQDTMVGGRGADAVSYSLRRRPVSADLDGRRDDGQRGERDRIVGVEGLTGGRAADRLVGDRHTNFLDGQEGPDQLFGGDGDDSLYGSNSRAGPGGDRLYAGRGNDEITGGEGRDLLVAGRASTWFGVQRGTTPCAPATALSTGSSRVKAATASGSTPATGFRQACPWTTPASARADALACTATARPACSSNRGTRRLLRATARCSWRATSPPSILAVRATLLHGASGRSALCGAAASADRQASRWPPTRGLLGYPCRSTAALSPRAVAAVEPQERW